MNETKDESLISHLEALRWTLLKCIISFCVALPFALAASPKVLNWLINTMLQDSRIKLNFFSPLEVFLIQIKTAFVLALILSFPYMAKKIWDFILPALYDNERKFIKKVVLSSSLLFVCGVGFCIFLILPMVIKFGLSFSTPDINPMFGLSSVINLALMMSAAFGIMFQTPLVAIALTKSGIISYESISNKRPYVIVIILILAAVLTPPDIVSQLMLGIPTYLLFELGLLCARSKDE